MAMPARLSTGWDCAAVAIVGEWQCKNTGPFASAVAITFGEVEVTLTADTVREFPDCCVNGSTTSKSYFVDDE